MLVRRARGTRLAGISSQSPVGRGDWAAPRGASLSESRERGQLLAQTTQGHPSRDPAGPPPRRARPPPLPAPLCAPGGPEFFCRGSFRGFCLYKGSLANCTLARLSQAGHYLYTRVWLPGQLRLQTHARLPLRQCLLLRFLLLLPSSRSVLTLSDLWHRVGAAALGPPPPSRSRFASLSPGEWNYLFIYVP